MLDSVHHASCPLFWSKIKQINLCYRNVLVGMYSIIGYKPKNTLNFKITVYTLKQPY